MEFHPENDDDDCMDFEDEYTNSFFIDNEYTNSFSIDKSLTNDYYEYEQGQKDIIVKGRLRQNIHFWKDTLKANTFIIDVIENGYKIPFYSMPPSSYLCNNKSALADSAFVSEAVQNLLHRGLIEKCGDHNLPYVINPLSVSVQSSGKKRLILDLRLVNKHLWKQSVKYEDLRTVLTYLEKDFWMIKFDIHTAFHSCDIFYPHTTFLGFSWPDSDGAVCYYKFLVLPFGIRSAPYLFCKITRPLVSNGEERARKLSCTLMTVLVVG